MRQTFFLAAAAAVFLASQASAQDTVSSSPAYDGVDRPAVEIMPHPRGDVYSPIAPAPAYPPEPQPHPEPGVWGDAGASSGGPDHCYLLQVHFPDWQEISRVASYMRAYCGL